MGRPGYDFPAGLFGICREFHYLRALKKISKGYPMERHTYRHDGGFSFESGGSVPTLEVGYHTSPMAYEKGMKVIWICHALTSDSNAEDWWSALVGPGKLFDTEKYFVVCCNMVGSCYGSSGPSSIDPETGKPYYFSFPKVTVRDVARAFDLVRIHLGIDKIDLLVGASMGGFQALEWSVLRPEVFPRAVYIATSSRVSPWLTAFEESQRMALEADSTFRACESLKGGSKGLECARTIALLSYRCEDGYIRKQSEQSDDVMFADRAGSYLRYQGNKLANIFDAYSYWYLTYLVDSDNLGRGRGGEVAALGMIRAESTFICFDTDLLFPPHKMKFMSENVKGSVYHEIKSHFGHDGFLLETDDLDRIMRPIVEKL